MFKTLMKEAHPPGTACDTRWCNNGLCGGTVTAHWLNSLNDDDDVYVGDVTCGKVRQNWLHGNSHVIPASMPWEKSCPTCSGRGKVTVHTRPEPDIVTEALEFYAAGNAGVASARRAVAALRRMK